MYSEFSGLTMIDIYKKITNNDYTVIAGPCAVESEEMIFSIAGLVKGAGADILRGGAYKMRTCVKDFQGLGKTGLKMLRDAGREYDLPIISEIVDINDVDLFFDLVDIIQVGTRNMYNYPLLKALAKTNKPVLLKRGMSATINEFLRACEYIEESGNNKIILCERGIRSFDSETRNVFDAGAVAILKGSCGYPVFADPSHACGRADIVSDLAYAAAACGADGVMIEVHENHKAALSDANQAICIDELITIIEKSKQIKKIIK
jgi:3-deoxy-7-phosphoheptulonate synthase